MLSNMATSLILSKRIITTLAKAKELRKYIEPLVTKAKSDTTHSRRVVFSYLQNKEGVKELFGNVAAKVADRPGGYTRILKTGNRLGDNAEMCMMEFVDFNELLGGGKLVVKETASAKRTRRGGAKKEDAPSVPKAKSPVVAAPVAEVPVEVAPVVEEEVVQEVESVEEVMETAAPEAMATEEVTNEIPEVVAEEAISADETSTSEEATSEESASEEENPKVEE